MKHCDAGLACCESVAEVRFLDATQAYIRLLVHKAFLGEWSPRTARCSDWGDEYLNLIGYTIAPLSSLVWNNQCIRKCRRLPAALISVLQQSRITVAVAQQHVGIAPHI